MQGPPLVSNAPSNTLPPIKTLDEFRLHFQSPPDCDIDDCSVYVAIDTNRGNDSWLDIYMEGKAEGWMGVGFTHTPDMVGSCGLFLVRMHAASYNSIIAIQTL